jgi:hypothetical protein
MHSHFVNQLWSVKMHSNSTDFNPISPEGYAIVMADSGLQRLYQDNLDAVFKERLNAVGSALGEFDWFGDRLSKDGYTFVYDFATVGEGTHIVGLKYELKDPREAFVYSQVDDLTKNPEQLASEFNDVVRAMTKPWSMTANQYLLVMEKQLGKDFDGLQESFIEEHYQSIENHVKGGGKITQEVLDNLETGKYRHFLRKYGDKSVQSADDNDSLTESPRP